jgi:acetyl-CoA carboxylase carboxyl transferase subunit alpha
VYNCRRRPYLDHVRALCGDTFLELHGDRGFKDDDGGLGKLVVSLYDWVNKRIHEDPSIQKLGMANPEGYRTALDEMKRSLFLF